MRRCPALSLGIVSILGVAVGNQPLDSSGVPVEFWFNLKTGQVEFGKLAAASYRVGPFDSEAEAHKALETLANRAQKWNEEEEN
jgi:hypothetical protein